MRKFFEYKTWSWKCFIPNHLSDPVEDPVDHIGLEIGYEEITLNWRVITKITYYLR